MRLIANPLLLASPSVELPAASDSQILMLSMRRVSDSVGYCFRYEFENIVADMLGAEVAYVTSTDGLDVGRQVYKAVRFLTGSADVAERVRPSLGAVPLQKDYDLFLPFLNHPHEAHALYALEGWRERTRFAACYLGEAYTGDLPRYLVEMLRRFDHIFVGVSGSVEAISNICDRPCSYLPIGIDALKFSPGVSAPERSIDICSIGRRSAVTHEALLRYAEKNALFYHYDTSKGGGRSPISFRVTSFEEHRSLLANVLKRSRYFIANRAWVDRPALTGGREEIPGRFYEGAAAGAIMLGEPPTTADFREQFGWVDSIVATPFDEPRISQLIAKLDADPERVSRARTENIVNGLLRFDWVYRLRSMLEVAGLPVTSAMHEREALLRACADEVRGASLVAQPTPRPTASAR
jgi:hypothetical protein